MGKAAKTTLVIKHGASYRRLAKIIFGSDGSYYATIPYHESRKATVFKMTTNYDAGTFFASSIQDILETAWIEDREIKFSHHPDGFAQFSGAGITSGRNPDGSAKGMAVLTSPLDRIFRGPAFNYLIRNIEELDPIETVDSKSLVFDLDEYLPIAPTNSLHFEAHYFTPLWRRFVRLDAKGRPIINVQHPCEANIEFRVFPAAAECDYPGILGFELYQLPHDGKETGYSFGGPAELMRRNEHGQRIADAIFCSYPRDERIAAEKCLNFPPVDPNTEES